MSHGHGRRKVTVGPGGGPPLSDARQWLTATLNASHSHRVLSRFRVRVAGAAAIMIVRVTSHAHVSQAPSHGPGGLVTESGAGP